MTETENVEGTEVPSPDAAPAARVVPRKHTKLDRDEGHRGDVACVSAEAAEHWDERLWCR